MLHTFTLHQDAWLRYGSDESNRVIVGYRVGGMPDGTTARLANFGAPDRDDWQIMRIHADNTHSNWFGHFDSVEEALTELQVEQTV